MSFPAANLNIQHALEKQILQVANTLEEQIDAKINELSKVDEETLEKLRDARLARMKEEAKLKQDLLSKGHGVYEELPEEAEFFQVIKKSKKVVIHFYRHETSRCKIFDHHLKIIAPRHIECRFVKVDAEKCPFLTERMQIKVLPLLLIVLDGKVKDRVIGFTDLGNKDDFTTECLEWRLGLSGVIDYDGDLSSPPDQKSSQSNFRRAKKNIRDSNRSGSDSEDTD